MEGYLMFLKFSEKDIFREGDFVIKNKFYRKKTSCLYIDNHKFLETNSKGFLWPIKRGNLKSTKIYPFYFIEGFFSKIFNEVVWTFFGFIKKNRFIFMPISTQGMDMIFISHVPMSILYYFIHYCGFKILKSAFSVHHWIPWVVDNIIPSYIQMEQWLIL